MCLLKAEDSQRLFFKLLVLFGKLAAPHLKDFFKYIVITAINMCSGALNITKETTKATKTWHVCTVGASNEPQMGPSV